MMPEDMERLARVESMLIFLLETMETEQVVKPNLEQAKALQVMGQPPWPQLTRKTNKYEIWRVSWERLLVKQRRPAHDAPSPSDGANG